MNTLAHHPPMKWSVEDYHRMIAAEILTGRSVELLCGEIVEMSPELPIHYNTTKRSSKYLEILFENKAEVRFNGPITLEDSEPEPDIVIARPLGRIYDSRHPYPEEVYLIIEVANTSLKKDLEDKSKIYAQAGIPEYWVVNLQTSAIHVFRDLQADFYAQETIVTAGTLTLAPFSNIPIEVLQLVP